MSTAALSSPGSARRRVATPAVEAADNAEPSGSRRSSSLHITQARPPGRRFTPRPDTRWLKSQLRSAIHVLNVRLDDLSVVIVDDERMSDLHLRYSGIEGTTDVLTFDLRDAPFPPLPLGEDRGEGTPRHSARHIDGEIYVCYDEAARQAGQRGHDVQRELLLYALHGVLHLLGYDDHDPADHAAMHAEEDRVLEAIGVGRVFSV